MEEVATEYNAMNKETSFSEICDSGLVCKVDGIFALVELGQNNTCSQCGFFDKCSAASRTPGKKIWAENRIGAKVGDNVKLSISSSQYMTSAALLFLLPMAILIVGYASLFYMGLSQMLAAFVAVFLSALAVPIVRVFEKKAFSKRLYYVVGTIEKQKEHP